VRIGHGYDVHRLVKGRKLILGGVEIRHSKGLLGHSDADVLCHAISDALLGAAGLGDIGKLFPDSDPQFAGISSLLLLREVRVLLGKKGLAIESIDSTIVLQTPKIAPFTSKMRENISNVLNLNISRISVKATTTEGLGFAGKEEGVAARHLTSKSKFKQLFNNTKPIIGMIHLLPLPGSPRYAGNMSDVVERACCDGEVLEQGGVDAVIIENYGDLPFYPDRVASETVAAITSVATQVKNMLALPIGINVLRNDGLSAISIATAIGADFVRINVYAGAVLTEQGILQGCAAKVARHRSFLRSGVLILADVAVKHGRSLVEAPVGDLVQEAIDRSLADGIIITGEATGKPTDLETVRQIKEEFTDIDVLVGSGVTAENVTEALAVADGIIVGTWFKDNALTCNPIDGKRVEKFMQIARAKKRD